MVIDEGAGSLAWRPAGILSHVRLPDPETKGLFWGEKPVIPATHGSSEHHWAPRGRRPKYH
jgi:hypothetical protein